MGSEAVPGTIDVPSWYKRLIFFVLKISISNKVYWIVRIIVSHASYVQYMR
jgi:hypothetical protein